MRPTTRGMYARTLILFSALLGFACGPLPDAISDRAGTLHRKSTIVKGTVTADPCRAARDAARLALAPLQNRADQSQAALQATGKAHFEVELSRYGTPRLLSGPGFSLSALLPHTGNIGEQIRQVLLENARLLGLGADDDLVVERVGTLGEHTIARLGQRHRGIRVQAAHVIATVDSQARVVHLHSGALPDIHVPATAQRTSAGVRAALLVARPNAGSTQVSLRIRPTTNAACGTAELAWLVSYTDVDGPRRGWLSDATGKLVEDASDQPAYSGRIPPVVGISHEVCPTSVVVEDRPCANSRIDPCVPSMGTDKYNVCLWMAEVWDYLGDENAHGVDAASDSYDDDPITCMKTKFMCGQSTAGGYAPLKMYSGWETRGVVAHEFGHGVVAHNMQDLPAQQARPVYEHLADMFAMAVDNIWRVESKNHVTRDWANPASVTSYPSGELTRFPVTFDDYFSHSEDGNNSDYYRKWHVPSTLLSHMIYNLAQQPGFSRYLAAEIVYRALRGEVLDSDSQAYFSPYAAALRQQADAMGYGAAMRTVQENAKLWMPAERILSTCYTRPGIAAGFDLVPPNYFPVSTLRVYYNDYAPGQYDKLMVTTRDAYGIWTTADTGLPPASVGGAVTAVNALSSWLWFVAWKAWDGTVKYAFRPAIVGLTWPTTMSTVAGVSTNADVKLVAGGSDVRLFYRDATTSRLRYVKWLGSTWSAPIDPPTGYQVVMGSGPSAAWDGTRFQISYLSGQGTLGVLQVRPTGSTDVWEEHDAFTQCIFDSTASNHTFTRAPAIAATANKALLFGPKAQTGDPPKLDQIVLKHDGSAQAWTLNGHGYMEAIGHEVDLAIEGDRLWAVTYSYGLYSGPASVSWRQK